MLVFTSSHLSGSGPGRFTSLQSWFSWGCPPLKAQPGVGCFLAHSSCCRQDPVSCRLLEAGPLFLLSCWPENIFDFGGPVGLSIGVLTWLKLALSKKQARGQESVGAPARWKPPLFYNLISEATFHHLCLFIRTKSLDTPHTQGEKVTQGSIC